MYSILAYLGHNNLNTWFLGQLKKKTTNGVLNLDLIFVALV